MARKGTDSSSTVASPVVRTYCSTTYGSHTRSSEKRVRTPRPVSGCHQCWTSPSTNWRAAARRMCARASRRFRVDQGHRVLQLVAESVGATELWYSPDAGPHPARERLVQRPAIEHRVQIGIGCPHRDGRQAGGFHSPTVASIAWRTRCRGRRIGRAARARPPLRRAAPSTVANSRVSPGSRISMNWRAAQGSSPSPVRSSSPPRRSAAGSARVPWRPMNSRRSAVCEVTGSVTPRNAT